MLNSPSRNQTIAFSMQVPTGIPLSTSRSTRELDNRLSHRHLELVLAGLRGEAAVAPLSRGDLRVRAD
jgi:hypothetical protein